MLVITHRGLDPGLPDFFTESSFEAFENHLSRGFGIEFDINFTKDKKIIIFHEEDLERITAGHDTRLFKDLEVKDIENIKLKKDHLCFLEELLEVIKRSGAKINALHLKGEFQEKKYLDILINHLNNYKDCLDKILIFDVKPNTAKYLKEKNDNLILAPSVAHDYDIARFNDCVGGSLISLDDAIKYKDLYDWIWLDEWDLNHRNGKSKKFYSKENFKTLRKTGFKIALVSPELHASSPGLLAGESHPDGANIEKLAKRMKEIVSLKPDAICTDYPDLIRDTFKLKNYDSLF